MQTSDKKINTSLVCPTLEYGSVVFCQASRIQMLESVQNKGARYVTQEWSRYSSITDIKDIVKLGWCTLQQHRYVNRLSLFFKSVNNLHGHSLPSHVTRQKRASKNHHTYSYHTLRVRTDAYLHSFLPRTIRALMICSFSSVSDSTPMSPSYTIYTTRAEPVPVCICPLAKPVPVCIYRDPNTKIKLSAKYQFCAIHTADNIITDGKVRMVRPIFRRLFTVSSFG